jgi:hypothetical protein
MQGGAPLPVICDGVAVHLGDKQTMARNSECVAAIDAPSFRSKRVAGMSVSSECSGSPIETNKTGIRT